MLIAQNIFNYIICALHSISLKFEIIYAMLLSGGLPYDRFAQAQKTRYLSKQAHRLSGHRADQGRDRHPPLRQIQSAQADGCSFARERCQ